MKSIVDTSFLSDPALGLESLLLASLSLLPLRRCGAPGWKRKTAPTDTRNPARPTAAAGFFV